MTKRIVRRDRTALDGLSGKSRFVEAGIEWETMTPEVDMIIGFDIQVNNDENNLSSEIER